MVTPELNKSCGQAQASMTEWSWRRDQVRELLRVSPDARAVISRQF